MIKIYFSASKLFDAIESKLRPAGVKLTLTAMEKETGISRHLLKQLRLGTCARCSSAMAESLYRYAVAVGADIAPDDVVQLVAVSKL